MDSLISDFGSGPKPAKWGFGIGNNNNNNKTQMWFPSTRSLCRFGRTIPLGRQHESMEMRGI